MNFWTHYITGIEDVWLALLISLFSVTHLTAKLIIAFKVRRLSTLHREQTGATYMLPLVLTIPIYVLFITMIIECTLLLTAKVGSVGAAYSAARAAAVWLPYENAMPQDAPDYTPLENRQTMVRLAAARAMFPYASGAPSHASDVVLDEFVAATANQQIAVFRAYSGNQNFDAEYLTRKFAYAYNSSTVEIKYLDPVSGGEYADNEVPAFNAKIQLTLRYEAPIHTYGIGRLFGERSQFGKHFIRPAVTTVTIENEGVKKPRLARPHNLDPENKSLGIRYYNLHLANPSAISAWGASMQGGPTPGRQIVLYGGRPNTGAFWDEFQAGRELARSRSSDASHVDEIPDLADYDLITLNIHGSEDVDDGEGNGPDGKIDAWYPRQNGQGDQALNAGQLAGLLRRHGFRGSVVELVQCNSVQFAQELANILGVEVIAYPHSTSIATFNGEVRRSDESWIGGRTTSPADPIRVKPKLN